MRILRVVGSRLLACGCFVGVYETYDGESIEIIEERGPRCQERWHRPDQAIRTPTGTPREERQQAV